MARPFFTTDFLHDISVDTQRTNPVQVPSWAKEASVHIPAQDANGIVGMQMMRIEDVTAALLLASNDTSWVAVRDKSESATVAASGVELVWIDITEFILSLPANAFIRFTTAAVQVGDATWYISFKG